MQKVNHASTQYVWVLIGKFVRRTFSRGSLGYNGRLNGGWWQRISEAKRTTIRIDDMETIEIDFSGMHPAILYAMKGVTPPGRGLLQIRVPL